MPGKSLNDLHTDSRKTIKECLAQHGLGTAATDCVIQNAAGNRDLMRDLLGKDLTPEQSEAVLSPLRQGRSPAFGSDGRRLIENIDHLLRQAAAERSPAQSPKARGIP
jgi:hypothetical protein